MNTNEKQEHIMGRVLLTAFRNGFVYDRTNAIHSGFKNTPTGVYIGKLAIRVSNSTESIQALYNAYKHGLQFDYVKQHLDTLTRPNLMKLLGNLYRHGILQPDYMKNGFDEIRDERKKVCALALAYRYGLRMDYAAHAVGKIKDEALRAKLLHRAYEYGTIPDRNVHQFSSLSDRTRVRVLKQAYAHGLSPDFDMDVVTGPSDATRASGLQNMYDSGAIARKDHLRKASGSTLSNGIVKKYGIAQRPLQKRLKQHQLLLKWLPVCVDVQEYVSDILVRQNL
jgi:hypothetical protein